MSSKRTARTGAPTRHPSGRPSGPPPLTSRQHQGREVISGQPPGGHLPEGMTRLGANISPHLVVAAVGAALVIFILLALGISLLGSRPGYPPTSQSSRPLVSSTDSTPRQPIVPAAAEGNTSPAGKGLVEMVKRIKPSVVHIETDTGYGTGFLVGANGVIVTNHHVIADTSSATAVFSGGRTVVVTRVLATEPEKDLALLQLDPRVSALPSPLRLRETLPEQGESVFAYGGPLGLNDSVSDGIISAVRMRQAGGTRSSITLIQHTAPISPGNSGGPLLNSRGEVIGVNTLASFGKAQNLNFAVSSREVINLLNRAGIARPNR